MSELWSAWGNSVIGPYHTQNGLPNQDAWLFRRITGGAAMAVSDGVSSKPYSDLGSKAACVSVMEAARIFARHPEGNSRYIPRLIHALWLLKTGEHNSSDCAATCLFTILTGGKLILGRVGDGMIVVLGKSGDIIIEDTTQDDPFVTDCLTSSFDARKWEIREIPADDCSAVVMYTDGITKDIEEQDNKIGFSREFFESYKHMERKKRSKEITQWLTQWHVRGHTDDKTLACLYRKEAGNA